MNKHEPLILSILGIKYQCAKFDGKFIVQSISGKNLNI